MNFSEVMDNIYRWMTQFIPILRIAWAGIIVIGLAMLITAFILKRNPIRKKSPWIVGGIGLLIIVSTSVQFVASFL